MNKQAAIEKTLSEYASLFTTGDELADLEVEGYQPSSALVTLGASIYSYMSDRYEKAALLAFEGVSNNTQHYVEEFGIEGNHELAMRVIWEGIAWALEDDINQALYEMVDDEATRKGL